MRYGAAPLQFLTETDANASRAVLKRSCLAVFHEPEDVASSGPSLSGQSVVGGGGEREGSEVVACRPLVDRAGDAPC